MEFNIINNNEIQTNINFELALQTIKDSFEKIGKVKTESESFLEGKIRYGFQLVSVRVSWVREGSTTRFVVQSQSDDFWNFGGRSACNRLVELIRNYNNPGYKIDRLGTHPSALIVLVILFTFCIWFIVQKLL